MPSSARLCRKGAKAWMLLPPVSRKVMPPTMLRVPSVTRASAVGVKVGVAASALSLTFELTRSTIAA